MIISFCTLLIYLKMVLTFFQPFIKQMLVRFCFSTWPEPVRILDWYWEMYGIKIILFLYFVDHEINRNPKDSL